jgi:hypothetical protein
MSTADIARALIVTAEVMGHDLSAPAAEAMARELAQYASSDVALALKRCQREVTSKLSLARVLERLPGQHISADEAWAMCPRSEAETVVWIEEISSAYAVAAPLLAQGDQVAARMAFRDAYQRAVGEAQARGEKPKWWPSLGHDVDGRSRVIQAAVSAGRLSSGSAQMLGITAGPDVPNALAASLAQKLAVRK